MEIMPKRPGQQARVANRLKANKVYNAARPERHKFYNTARWRRLRDWYRKQHPLCRECEKRGIVTPGAVVDHIVPIEDGGALMDADNLQHLCMACHNRKHSKSHGEGG
jgi:5-methylcytosine-specific restriction protein A